MEINNSPYLFLHYMGSDRSDFGRADSSNFDVDVVRRNGFHVNLSGEASVSEEYEKVREQRKEQLKNGGDVLKTGNVDIDVSKFIDSIQSAKEFFAESNPYVETKIQAHATHLGMGATPVLMPLMGLSGAMPGEVFLQSDPKAELKHQRANLENFLELRETEKMLSAEYGEDIKLAYDMNADNYIMLRPGDVGYNKMKSSDQVLQETKEFLRRGFGNKADYIDIFEKYGVSI